MQKNEGLTGIEAGLFTTTKSSSMCTILISSEDTGTSCLEVEENVFVEKGVCKLRKEQKIRKFSREIMYYTKQQNF